MTETFSVPQLNANYWDCECQGSDYSYIKDKSQYECKDCGAIQEEAPDSHASEVRASMIAKRMQGKLEGHHFAVTYKDKDCDFGSCTGYTIKNLGLTIYTYDDDPTRLSIHIDKGGK